MQVALALGAGQRQGQELPDAGAKGPDGQLLGVLHGEHGDRQLRCAAFDLQQQVEADAVRTVELQAEHVGAGRQGQFVQPVGAVGQADPAVRLEGRDAVCRCAVAAQVEPEQKGLACGFGFGVHAGDTLLTKYNVNLRSVERLVRV